MPFFDLSCPRCELTSEHMMGPHDENLNIPCPKCQYIMTRRVHQDYRGKRIQIHGDTCAGACDMSNYYDDALDMHIKSRDHRKEVMKEKGLVDYAAEPDMAAARKEGRYILNNAPKGDKTALHAARKQSRDVDSARKDRIIGAAVDKARVGLEK